MDSQSDSKDLTLASKIVLWLGRSTAYVLMAVSAVGLAYFGLFVSPFLFVFIVCVSIAALAPKAWYVTPTKRKVLAVCLLVAFSGPIHFALESWPDVSIWDVLLPAVPIVLLLSALLVARIPSKAA